MSVQAAVGNDLKNAGPIVPACPHLTHQMAKRQITTNQTDNRMGVGGC